MTDAHHDDPQEDEDLSVSKSERKRQMHALQALGDKILTLNETQLASIPLTAELEKAIGEAKRIKSREGLRRQKQYIGKLMRVTDHEAIEAALEAISDKQNRLARAFHVMEQWRDELIEGDNAVVERFINEFPNVDIQQFRSVVRAAKSEKTKNKPPASARKLFKLIRDQMAEQ